MKKYICLILSVVMLLIMVASCQKNKEKKDSQESQESKATTETTEYDPMTVPPVMYKGSAEAENVFDTGYYHEQCTYSGEYIFDDRLTGDTNWTVYILDEEFQDAERYISQAYEPALTNSGSVEVKEGQWIYVYCDVNAYTASEAGTGAYSWSVLRDYA